MQLLASDTVRKNYGVYKEEENVSFRALFLLDPPWRSASTLFAAP